MLAAKFAVHILLVCAALTQSNQRKLQLNLRNCYKWTLIQKKKTKKTNIKTYKERVTNNLYRLLISIAQTLLSPDTHSRLRL